MNANSNTSDISIRIILDTSEFPSKLRRLRMEP